MINTVIVEGNLTRDPELSYTPNQVAVCKFGIACNNKRGEYEDTYFANCEAWKSTAENIQKFFKKGKRIIVEGSLGTDSWEKDGQKRSKDKITVFKFHFVGPKDSAQSVNRDSQSEPAVDTDDIPF